METLSNKVTVSLRDAYLKNAILRVSCRCLKIRVYELDV